MGLYDKSYGDAFLDSALEADRLRQEEEARKQQALAELQAKQEKVAALIGIGNQRQQEAEAKAAAQNMGKMVEQFTKEPVVYGPVEPPPPKPATPPREPVMIPDAQGNLINTEYPGVIAPDGPKAEVVPMDGPKAEAALLQDNPLDMGEEPPPEDGPKAELAAEQAAIAEGERVALAAQQQAEAERRALSLAHFTAVGADPQTASVFAEELEAIKKDVFDPLSSAAALDGQAKMVRANAQDKRYGEEATAWEEYTPASKAAINDLLVKTEDRMTKIAAIDAKIAAGEIDPNRVWNNTSDMGKAFIGLGAGMYRLLQLKQGNIGGQNVVLNALDTAIERDINAQKANMDLLIQQRGMQRQSMADEINIYGLQEAALERGRMARINTAIAVMNQEIASGALPLEAQSQYIKDIAELRAKYYDSLHKLGGALSGVVKQQVGRIGKANKIQVGSGLYTDDPFGVGEDMLMFSPSASAAAKNDWHTSSRARRKIADMLNQFNQVAQEVGRSNQFVRDSRWGNQKQRVLQTIVSSIIDEGRKLKGAGANFTEHEIKLIKEAFNADILGIFKGAPNQSAGIDRSLRLLRLGQRIDNTLVINRAENAYDSFFNLKEIEVGSGAKGKKDPIAESLKGLNAEEETERLANAKYLVGAIAERRGNFLQKGAAATGPVIHTRATLVSLSGSEDSQIARDADALLELLDEQLDETTNKPKELSWAEAALRGVDRHGNKKSIK